VDYPDGDLQLMPRCLSTAEVARSFNPATVSGAILAGERAVEVNAVAQLLRAVVANEPRIRAHLETFVQHAERHPLGSLELTVVRSGEARRVWHEAVVNALSDGRLAVDRSLGPSPALGKAVAAFGGSLSVDPGNYSLAPWFAEHVAADIVGISPC
jgi:hypothetical protein